MAMLAVRFPLVPPLDSKDCQKVHSYQFRRPLVLKVLAEFRLNVLTGRVGV